MVAAVQRIFFCHSCEIVEVVVSTRARAELEKHPVIGQSGDVCLDSEDNIHLREAS